MTAREQALVRLTRRRKPRLTPFECRVIDRVHQHIIQYDCRGLPALMSAFSDQNDGWFYEREVASLVGKGLLGWEKIERAEQHPGDLLGCIRSAYLTKRAIDIFWPDRLAAARRAQKDSNNG